MTARRSLLVRMVVVAAMALTGVVVIAKVADGDGGPGAEASAARWSKRAPGPFARTEVGAARIGDSIYVVGGFLAPTGETTDRVARYDIEADRWEQLAPMPVGVNHPAVAALGGVLYVHGGYTAAGGLTAETDAMQRFDPATGAWGTLAPSGFPRAAHALVPVGGRLYAIGGASGGVALKLVQVFDTATGAWSEGPPLRTAREHLAAAVAKGRVYALAGRTAGQNLDSAERLTPGQGGWRKLSPLRVARSGFGAATVKGRIVAVGGEQLAEGDETIRRVEVLDPKRKRWRRLPGMLTPRHGLGVVAKGRLVFALEGGPSPGSSFSSTLEVLRVPPRGKKG